MMTNLIVNKNERILNKVKGGDSIKKTKFISDRKIMKGMVNKRRQQKTDRVSDNWERPHTITYKVFGIKKLVISIY